MQRNSYCLKAPSLFPFTEVPTMCDFHARLQMGVGSGPISRRGWQADGCLNELSYFQYMEFLYCTGARG